MITVVSYQINQLHFINYFIIAITQIRQINKYIVGAKPRTTAVHIKTII